MQRLSSVMPIPRRTRLWPKSNFSTVTTARWFRNSPPSRVRKRHPKTVMSETSSTAIPRLSGTRLGQAPVPDHHTSSYLTSNEPSIYGLSGCSKGNAVTTRRFAYSTFLSAMFDPNCRTRHRTLFRQSLTLAPRGKRQICLTRRESKMTRPQASTRSKASFGTRRRWYQKPRGKANASCFDSKERCKWQIST